jgi:methionyl-tRNA formyltransferase
LVEAGYQIEAVLASHADGVSRQKRDLEIGSIAHAYHIPVVLPEDKVPLYDKVKKYAAEAAVLVAYGRIIPQEVIDIFPKGIINLHPSLLPKLRGSTPIESAILEGLSQTGVSLMALTAQMDAGPIYAQAKVKLGGKETKQELADTLLEEGAKLLIDNLEGILSGALQPVSQNEQDATYTKQLRKNDGLMNPDKPAELLEREIRAFLGWPKSVARLYGQKVVVTKARVVKSDNHGSLVMCCNPGWLEIQELIAPSGRTMNGEDFIRGYKKD